MVSIGPALRKEEKENKEEVLSAIDLHQVFRFFPRPTIFFPSFPFPFCYCFYRYPLKKQTTTTTPPPLSK
jgi:hypothetical protein